jgi:hypothetical protein
VLRMLILPMTRHDYLALSPSGTGPFLFANQTLRDRVRRIAAQRRLKGFYRDFMDTPPTTTVESSQLIRVNRVHTQTTFPERTKKCDRQPPLSQIDGMSEGRFLSSTLSVHLGLASRSSGSSTSLLQPQGQRIVTDQSSPFSRSMTKSRLGNFAGTTSPEIIIN